MPVFRSLIYTLFVALFLFSGSVSAKEKALPFSPEQQAALEDFSRDFIMDNPELIMESIDRFHMEQRGKQEQQASENIIKYQEFLRKSQDLPVAGNPNGDIMVVEFFDYNCGYCKKALTSLLKLIEEDKNVRVVFMELPILSPASRTAASWALASNKQGKYMEFHKAAMTYRGGLSEKTLKKIGEDLGLDIAKLEEDAGSDETKAMLAKIRDISQDLAISGTPAFLIEDTVIRGFVPYDALKSGVEAIRKSKK